MVLKFIGTQNTLSGVAEVSSRLVMFLDNALGYVFFKSRPCCPTFVLVFACVLRNSSWLLAVLAQVFDIKFPCVILAYESMKSHEDTWRSVGYEVWFKDVQ